MIPHLISFFRRRSARPAANVKLRSTALVLGAALPLLATGTSPAGAAEEPSAKTSETIDQLRQQVRTAEAQVRTLTEMLDDLRRELKTHDADSQSLREKAVQLSGENSRLRGQLDLLAKERDAALKELEIARTESSEAKGLAEKLLEEKKAVVSQEQQVKVADITAQRMQAQLLDQSRRLKEAQAALAALENERRLWTKGQPSPAPQARVAPPPAKAEYGLRTETAEQIPPVYFATSNTRISEDYARVLKAIKEVLAQSPGARFTLTGHSSKEGSEQMNLRFSAFRAESLAKFLTTRGIPRDRLTVVAAGSNHPIAASDSNAEDRKNRRVEIAVER